MQTLTQVSLRKRNARKCLCPETLRENMSIIKFYFSLFVRISCFTSEIRSGSCPVTVLQLLFTLLRRLLVSLFPSIIKYAFFSLLDFVTSNIKIFTKDELSHESYCITGIKHGIVLVYLIT